MVAWRALAGVLLKFSAGLTAASHWPVGDPGATVTTIDKVGEGRAGYFHFLAVDNGLQPRYVYAADSDRNVIRRKDVATGVWQVIAGQEGKAGARDGPPGTSLFDRPSSVCLNPLGQLVVADWGNSCLRLVSPDGMTSTLAGVCGSTGGQDGPGSTALFGDELKSIVCLANCSVLVGDESNGKIRAVLVHDDACAAAAQAAAARRHTAGALWLTGLLAGLATLAAAALAVVAAQHSGWLVYRVQRPGSGGAAGYDRLPAEAGGQEQEAAAP